MGSAAGMVPPFGQRSGDTLPLSPVVVAIQCAVENVMGKDVEPFSRAIDGVFKSTMETAMKSAMVRIEDYVRARVEADRQQLLLRIGALEAEASIRKEDVHELRAQIARLERTDSRAGVPAGPAGGMPARFVAALSNNNSGRAVDSSQTSSDDSSQTSSDDSSRSPSRSSAAAGQVSDGQEENSDGQGRSGKRAKTLSPDETKLLAQQYYGEMMDDFVD